MSELTDSFDCTDLAERSRRIRGLARSIVRDESRADDLAQQVVMQELARHDGDGGPCRSRGWFARTLRNLASKEARGDARRVRRERVAGAHAASEAGSAADAVQHAETLRQVVSAVLELEEPYRSTILLRYLKEQSVEEVARWMGVPASTVRVRTKRAIELLRESLRRSLGNGYALLLTRFWLPASASVPTSTPTPSTRGIEMNHIATWLTATTVGVLSIAIATDFLGPNGLPPAAPSPHAATEVPASAGGAADRTRVELVASRADDTRSSTGIQGGTPPLELSVVDEHGAPVVGATVRVYDQPFVGSDRMHSGAHVPVPVTATSDATGRVRVSACHPFAAWGVEVRAAGYAAAFFSFRPDSEDRIVLFPATALDGVVTAAETGAPLAGVAVRVPDVRFDGERLWRSRAVVTDAGGRYHLDGIAAHTRTRVEFARSGAASWFATLNLEPGASTTYDVALASGARVEIRAYDESSTRPIAGARVYRVGYETESLGTVDSRGRLLVDLPVQVGATRGWPDEAQPAFCVEADGYCATRARAPVVAQGSIGELRMGLVACGSVTGIVRDASGEPVRGARVGWQSAPLRFVEPLAAAMPSLDSLEAVTDQDGMFALPHVPPAGRSVEGRLRVEAGGDVAFCDHALPPEAGAVRQVEIAVGRGRAVSGRAFVNGVAGPAWIYLRALGESDVRRESTVATSDGRFAFFRIPPGAYGLRAVTADGTAIEGAPLEIEVAGLDVPDLRLDIHAALGVIRGHVLHDDGTPVPGAEVIAFHSGTVPTEEDDAIETPEDAMLLGPEGSGIAGTQISSLAKVSQDGTFEMTVPADLSARYQLGVYQGGFGVVVRNVRQGMNDVELRVPPLARVRVTPCDASTGRPIPRVGVRWHHAASDRTVTLAWRRPKDTLDGVLALDLPVGHVELTLRDADSGVEATVVIDVPAEGVEQPVRVEI